MITQKGNVYYVVITYRDELGRKKKKWIRSGTSKRDAERLERSLMTDIARGDLVISGKITVADFLEKWMDTAVRPYRRPSTIANYEYYVQRISAGIGHIEAAKLTRLQVQKFVNEEKEKPLQSKRKEEPKRKRSERDKAKLKPIKKVSPTTITAMVYLLRQAMNKAIIWGLRTKNPCDGVDVPGREQSKSYIVYDPSQAEALQDFVRDTKFFIPTSLGFQCGLRRGEICGLRFSDLDRDAQGANIRNSLDRMNTDDAKRLEEDGAITVFWDSMTPKAKTVLVLGPVKTDESNGFIPIPTDIWDVLIEEEARQTSHKKEFGESYQDHGFIWAWPEGRPHDPDYLYHQLKRQVEKYNEGKTIDEQLPPLHPHAMRHSHATFLLRHHVDVKLVSKQLRHKRASFTRDEYQHVQQDMQYETSAVMNDMFGKKEQKTSTGK